MIDKLIQKYEEELKILGHDGFAYDEEKYGKWLFCEKVIKDLKKLREPTIMGHTVEEVITILKALEIERIYDIKVTMENLSKLSNILVQENQKVMEHSFEQATKSFNKIVGSDTDVKD